MIQHILTCVALLAVVLAICAVLDRIPGFDKAYDRIASTIIVIGGIVALCYWLGGWSSLFFGLGIMALGYGGAPRLR